jgi:ElaA protein
VLTEADGTARIGRVCVARAARRQGHAATLLAAALSEIGERESVLDAQTYATDLYTRAGFVQDGPEFVEDGIPHIPMRRKSD